LHRCAAPRLPPPAPTRRSSDLAPPVADPAPPPLVPFAPPAAASSAYWLPHPASAIRIATSTATARFMRCSFLVAHFSADAGARGDRKSTRLNSSHEWISYAVFC